MSGSLTFLTSMKSGSALLTSLESYWKLDEASGTRNDSHGANHLTDNNTVTSAAGIIGNAAQYTSGNNESLSHVDNASLSIGDIDFTFSFWVNITDVVVGLIQKDNGASGGIASYYNGAGGIVFYVKCVSGTITNSTVFTTFSAWTHVRLYHDSTADLIGTSINNAAPTTLTTGGSPIITSAAALEIGYASSTGLIDEFGFWKRLLTPTECTAIYNGGAGLTYPF